jgi:hypothetical protein
MGGRGALVGDWVEPFKVKSACSPSVMIGPREILLTSSSVASAVAPPLEDVAPFVVGRAGSAATSVASRKGFLEMGRGGGTPASGLVEPEPTLLRKGLLEARGELRRSVDVLVRIT